MTHFDAIVIGSGFGGSVMAYRLAEAGRSVCLLERGRAYPPGSFARSPYRARDSFWDPERGRMGMYHYFSFKGIDALVSAGPRRRLADLRERAPAQGRALVRDRGPRRRRVRALAGHARGPRPALRPRRGDGRRPALSVRARAVREHAEDDRLQARGRAQRARVVPAAAGRHLRQRRASSRGRARRSRRSCATCTTATASRASCAASATSAATTAPRTRSTTTTSPTPPTTAPRSARCATSARSSRARAAASPSGTRISATRTARPPATGAPRRCRR